MYTSSAHWFSKKHSYTNLKLHGCSLITTICNFVSISFVSCSVTCWSQIKAIGKHQWGGGQLHQMESMTPEVSCDVSTKLLTTRVTQHKGAAVEKSCRQRHHSCILISYFYCALLLCVNPMICSLAWTHYPSAVGPTWASIPGWMWSDWDDWFWGTKGTEFSILIG